MINLGKSILTWTWGDITISQHKSFEYQFEFGKSTPTNKIFEFLIEVTTKRNHAGPNFTFGIKNLFWICLKIYDHRHWNEEEDRWETYK